MPASHGARTGAWIALVTQAGSTVDEDFPDWLRLCRRTGTWRAAGLGCRTVDRPPLVSRWSLCARPRGCWWSTTMRDGPFSFGFLTDLGHTWWAAPGGGLSPGSPSAVLRGKL